MAGVCFCVLDYQNTIKALVHKLIAGGKLCFENKFMLHRHPKCHKNKFMLHRHPKCHMQSKCHSLDRLARLSCILS
jgi:hypothetical protein